jgi:hypothetical protein
MSVVRTLAVTVTGEEEVTITFKSSPETGKIIVTPNDPGVYSLEELEAAIKACKEFS